MNNTRLLDLALQVCAELSDAGAAKPVTKGTLAKAQKVHREIRRRQCRLLAAELDRYCGRRLGDG